MTRPTPSAPTSSAAGAACRQQPGRLLTTAWCRLLVLAVLPAAATAADLTVDITRARVDGGVLRVALHDGNTAFPGGAPLKGLELPLGQHQAVFRDLAPGRYAVVVFQDENGNGKLDRGLFNIPSEPYGFSRDARGEGGPPAFRDAVLDLPETGLKTTLRLR